MNKIRPGLGRGLDALINPSTREDLARPVSGEKLAEDDGTSNEVLVSLPVDKILPNPFQPRVEFDSQTLDELKRSILQNGLIQPITVRRSSDEKYYSRIYIPSRYKRSDARARIN